MDIYMHKIQNIEVFKTSISKDAKHSVTEKLMAKFPDLDVNIDIEDCDKILRVAGMQLQNDQIIKIVKSFGFQCELL